MQSVQKYCCSIFSWACRDETSNNINSNVMEQKCRQYLCCRPVGLSGTTPKAAAHVNKYSGRPHQQARTTQAHITVKPTFFFFVYHKVVGSQGSQLDRKNKTKSVSQNHLEHYLCAVHQPLRGFLVEIEDVLHNNFSENIKQACSQYKSSGPSIFSQVGLTVLWNTKWALIL
jgi:hypothetical protein